MLVLWLDVPVMTIPQIAIRVISTIIPIINLFSLIISIVLGSVLRLRVLGLLFWGSSNMLFVFKFLGL